MKRSLLPFLGDVLKWLQGTTTTRDTWEIKVHVNQLIQTQSKQETLVHVISILNVTRYAAQVNRQKMNEIMDALQRLNEDFDRLFNITETLTHHTLDTKTNVHLHAHHISLSQRLSYLYEVICHAHDGLCGCSQKCVIT